MTRWTWLIPVLVVGLYWSHVLTAGWVYEDPRLFPAMTAPLTLGARALSEASWRLTQTPQAAHALSVGLHLGVVALLGALAWRLGYSRAGVGLVAVFAAVHPLTVETVAYAAARSELLAAIGVLGAVWCAAGRWWRPWPMLGMLVGVAVGLLSKESAVVAVALVPLTIWVQRRRDVPRGTIGVVLAMVFLLVLVGMWPLDLARVVDRVANIGESTGMRVKPLAWALLQSAAAFRLVGLTIWPAGLTVDPDIDLIPLAMQWAAVAGLGGIAGLAWLLRRRRPLVAYGLAWCLLGILPRLLVQTPRGYFNDHQFYLPLLGCILAGVGGWDAWNQAD